MIKLSEIAIYPIKSTAQLSLPEAQMGPFGFDMDRRWMLIDEAGTMLTQRKHPRMCLIQAQPKDDQLLVSAVDMPPLRIVRQNTSNLIKATVWDDTCNAYDCGKEAADWFSSFLNTPVRLVEFPENEVRQVDLEYANKGDITAFSDGFPYLLISQASLDDLNQRLQTAVEMKRFRPNLVVQGNVAFEEDNWKKIRIGEVIFRLVKPCSRCSIPSIDPQTAERSAEVVRTLAEYRMQGNKILFGQNLIAESTGKLQLGMEIEVLE